MHRQGWRTARQEGRKPTTPRTGRSPPIPNAAWSSAISPRLSGPKRWSAARTRIGRPAMTGQRPQSRSVSRNSPPGTWRPRSRAQSVPRGRAARRATVGSVGAAHPLRARACVRAHPEHRNAPPRPGRSGASQRHPAATRPRHLQWRWPRATRAPPASPGRRAPTARARGGRNRKHGGAFSLQP